MPYLHARRRRGLRPVGRVLEDEAVRGVDGEPPGGDEEDVGRGLPRLHLGVGAAADGRVEQVENLPVQVQARLSSAINLTGTLC